MSSRKKILFIFTQYPSNEKSTYLTNELVDGYHARGYSVTAIGYDKTRQGIFTRRCEHKKEVFIGLDSKIKYAKYFFIWPKLFYAVIKELVESEKYSYVVMNAPLMTLFPAVLLLPFFRSARKAIIIFDLFPMHQIQAGAIPACLGRVLKYSEGSCLKLFDKVGVMGANNELAVISHYNVPTYKIVITGIWGVRNLENPIPIRELDNTGFIRFVFGGQLVPGRRVDLFIEFLIQLKKSMLNATITLDIFSSGAIFEDLKRKYTGCDWINFRCPLSREEYIHRLENYDFGVIVTDENVTLPTLPSKIIDYINASLRTVAMVEDFCELRTKDYYSSNVILLPFEFSADDVSNFKELIRNVEGNDLYAESFKKKFSTKRTISVLLDDS